MSVIYSCDPPVRQQPVPVEEVSNLTSEALKTAIQNELKEMIDGEIGIATLQIIGRFANVAQELLMVRTPIADVRRKRVPNYALGLGQFSGNYPGGPNEYLGEPGYDAPIPLAGEAAENETFGTKLIRELVPALSSLKHGTSIDYQNLVQAIADAKEKGLDNLAAKLEAMLDGGDLPAQQDINGAKPQQLEAASGSIEVPTP